MQNIKVIDVLAGVGGIRLGFQNAAMNLGLTTECVFTSEIDRWACKTYSKNFKDDKHNPQCDITKVNEIDIPDFDVRPPSAFEQVKTIAGDVFGWVEQNQGKLLDAYNIFQSIRGGQPINIPSSPVDGIPPIPE